MATRYPNIEKAHLAIAYDNGGIRSDRPQNRATTELRRFLEGVPYEREQLTAIDVWLGTLNAEQMETVCAGERTEAEAILDAAPPFTDALLEEIFDHVC